MTQQRSDGPDEVEREFAETLRQAAWIFEKTKGGRFQGSIIACRAAAQFISRRDGGAELAAPFLHIAEAFKCLEKGGKPRLFSKKNVPEKERERSPERKHLQMLAAMALEVCVELGDEMNIAAERIARKVNHWPSMSAQDLTGNTIVAWRKQQRRSSNEEFAGLVAITLAEHDPRRTIEDLLTNGPPGQYDG